MDYVTKGTLMVQNKKAHHVSGQKDIIVPSVSSNK